MIAALLMTLALNDGPGQKPDTARAPVWALPTTTVTAGDAITAWLSVTPRGTAGRVVIQLVSDSVTTEWFASASPPYCERLDTAARTVGVSSAVVRVCAKTREPGSVRLLAIVRDSGGAAPVQIVATEAIVAKSRYNVDFPGWLVTLLTTIFGFASGIALQKWQQASQRKETAVKHRQELEQSLTDSLAPELARNLATLRGIVGGGPLVALTTNSAAAFRTANTSAFGYLSNDARSALENVVALYAAFGEYHDRRVRWEQADSKQPKASNVKELEDAARAAARMLQDALAGDAGIASATDVVKRIRALP